MDLPDLARPELLWLLLALPILYLLSLPPRARSEVLTAHMRQWRRALDRIGRRSLRFRRLRFWLLVLAATAAIFAAAEPSLPGEPGPLRLVVLLDSSASMGAEPGGAAETAWEEALQALEEGLGRVPAGVQVQVVTSSGTEILAGTPEEILAALPGQAQGTASLALGSLASSLHGSEQAVWTISDGRDPSMLASQGALSLVGTPLPNRGFVACELEDSWPLPDLKLRLELASFGDAAETLQVAYSAPTGQGRIPVELASARQSAEFEFSRGPGGLLEIRIEGQDALAADDLLRISIPAPPAPDIALLSEGEDSPWLRMAAETLAEEAGGSVLDGDATSAGFLLVEAGWLPGLWGRGISFGTGFGAGPEPSASWREQPQLLDWRREHRITQGLDFSDLQIDRALAGESLPPGIPLLWSEDAPLAVLAGDPEQRSLHFAFQLGESNLALLPAFPQLLRRAFAISYGRLAQ
ncbi:MAG: BatA domain-containing protein, partial [Planctomycetota bacterium]